MSSRRKSGGEDEDRNHPDPSWEWLSPWAPCDPGLEDELAREVGPDHLLSGRRAVSLGRRHDTDDVLFWLPDGPEPYAVVRLSWTGRCEAGPDWPWTEFYASADDWVQRRMVPDHERAAHPERGGSLKVITYQDRVTPVQLGDYVQTRVFFKKYRGRVVYVPGISALNPAMERDGLTWVGIRLDEGGFVSSLVDPDEHFLVRKHVLLRRDPAPIAPLGLSEDPHPGGSFPGV